MRINYILWPAIAMMASTAQAEPVAIEPSNPMRLTIQQMDNITAGANNGVRVISAALGTVWSYSSNTNYFIKTDRETPFRGHTRAEICCSNDSFSSVTVKPGPYLTIITHLIAQLHHQAR